MDPYEKVKVELVPDLVVGGPGKDPGLFDAPRGLATAPDGSLLVADFRNNRIQHLRADGSVIGMWGSFADSSKGEAAGGTFNEPWGVAVGSDGSVYVTDTWNHRVQKFDTNGNFITMWGSLDKLKNRMHSGVRVEFMLTGITMFLLQTPEINASLCLMRMVLLLHNSVHMV